MPELRQTIWTEGEFRTYTSGIGGGIVLDTAKLDAMIASNPQRIADVVGKTAFRILANAMMIAPRDPARPPKDPSRQVYGHLRGASGEADANVVKMDEKGLTRRVEFYAEYAIYQELGAPAINLPARPFLTPSVEKQVEQFINDLAKAIE